MTTRRNSTQLHGRLFRFTAAEERAMARAILRSIAFMESYGKGRQPYTIDYSHYENSRHPSDAQPHPAQP